MSQGGPEPGRLLGERYRLTSIVGRGGMGTVWRARDEVLDRDVAVKEVIAPRDLADADRDRMRQRTLREARATARLNHPNIVTVHDVVDEAGRPWIVMEFVQARSLQDIVDEEGALEPRRVAELGRQTLAALRAAHGIGILHRDVKPSNVLITEDGRVVLTDFGIAYIEGDTTLTQTGLIVGSPAYLAPERAKGERAVPASDLWALGATLYAACEGRPPYQRTDAVSVLAAILTEDPAPSRNAGPLRPVLHGLLQRDPGHRMSAETAAGLLAQIAAGTATSPGPPGYAPPPTAPYVPSVPPPHAGTPHIPYGHATPQPYQSRKGTTTGLFITIGVLATAVVVLAGVLILRSVNDTTSPPGPDGSTAQARQQGANTQAPPGGTSASPSASPTGGHGLPAGWRRGSGPGFTIGVPAGWRRSVEGRCVFWRDPSSAAYLQVDRTEWTGAPYQAWEQWEGEVLAKGSLKNYSRVDLRNVDDASYEAADIEFTWDGLSGQPMHGVDRRAIAGGQRFAVFVAIPTARWSASQDLVTGFLTTFRPAQAG
jgi:tRNA A-37 threonylcarbamoyl transferase component Bud32